MKTINFNNYIEFLIFCGFKDLAKQETEYCNKFGTPSINFINYIKLDRDTNKRFLKQQ